MEDQSVVASDIEKTTSFLSNAIQLAVTTALQLVDLSKGSEEKKLELGPKPLRISPLRERDLPEITLDQVSWHDQYDDCWVTLYDRVFDITEFLEKHPGGADLLLEYAGRDATMAFRGFGHSAQACQVLQNYLIGVLPEHERSGIFKEEDKFVGMNFQLRAAT